MDLETCHCLAISQQKSLGFYITYWELGWVYVFFRRLLDDTKFDDYNLYPHPTESVACKEQLRVLAKFISTGTRLADSIFKSLEEYNSRSDRENVWV